MRGTLGLRSFFQSASRLLKLATKPGRTELWLSIKICFLGIIAIGGIGFLIKIIFQGVNGLLG
ncbi:MAG: protein translocase SEC61 complex subunit gamma [Candidatus Bathyarchaeum sp.]|nr:MAG: protein translocase SEC61 complex subunit gamma [Candidatus Bathyarchaeum sp.]